MIYNYNTKEITEDKPDKLLLFLYNNLMGRIILRIIITKPISILGGIYMNSRLSKYRIKRFIKKSDIDMSDYPKENYKSFNDFFTRKIKPNKRKFNKDNSVLVSPCDSKLSIYKIDNNLKLTIKNSIYTVEELLQDKAMAKEYKNGTCLVFRLSVDDYHRYHYLDSGKTLLNRKINGVFHTVNPLAFKRYKVFSENSREYTVMDTDNFGKIIQIEVGALMVGKIKNSNKKKFTRGEEKGYFCFGGSTIVILFKKDTILVDDKIINNTNQSIETKVKLGCAIGRKLG